MVIVKQIGVNVLYSGFYFFSLTTYFGQFMIALICSTA